MSRKGPEKWNTGPLLVDELSRSSKLSENVFSFYMTSYDSKEVSFVDFGAYLPDHIKFGSEIAWIDLEPHFYWKSPQAYGVKINESAYNLGKNKYTAIFDTGTSLTLIPEPLYDKVIAQIKNKLSK